MSFACRRTRKKSRAGPGNDTQQKENIGRVAAYTAHESTKAQSKQCDAFLYQAWQEKDRFFDRLSKRDRSRICKKNGITRIRIREAGDVAKKRKHRSSAKQICASVFLRRLRLL